MAYMVIRARIVRSEMRSYQIERDGDGFSCWVRKSAFSPESDELADELEQAGSDRTASFEVEQDALEEAGWLDE